MNFEFSDEQNMLREQAQTFLRAECPPQAVRQVLDGDAPFDRGLWQKVVEMGWTSETNRPCSRPIEAAHMSREAQDLDVVLQVERRPDEPQIDSERPAAARRPLHEL